jgi:hypothetical protein
MTDLVPRREAIRLLRSDRRQVERLLAPMSPRALATPGLGGGTWSPKDLVGHLESWEEHALAAMDAWSRGEPAPIDRALRQRGTPRVNAEEVERKAARSLAKTLSSASGTHEMLLDALRRISDEAWAAPPTARIRVPLGARVGGILAGTTEPFRHDEAHLADLRGFAAERR